MIKSISVKNYILIDELTLNFGEGLNVFTGETGAGKSIIIGAIDAALGAKVSKDVIKTGCDRAYIELTIALDSNFDTTVLADNGIEIFDNEIIISKEILPTSARSRINGVMVTQDFIKDIRERLLDIHTQHQNYNYIQQKFEVSSLPDCTTVIYTDVEKPILRYTKRVEKEVFFSCEFAMALAYYLASLTANVIVGSIQKGEMAWEKYTKILSHAKVLNAYENGENLYEENTYIDSRQ